MPGARRPEILSIPKEGVTFEVRDNKLAWSASIWTVIWLLA
jgi:hypothetical protein